MPPVCEKNDADLSQRASSGHPQIRVLTVDERPLVRDAFSAVINRESYARVVAQASSGAEAIDQFRRSRADVVTMDVNLPDMSSDVAVTRLLDQFPLARVVVIVGNADDLHIIRLWRAGVKGFVLKGMSAQELLDTISRVHNGEQVIPPQVSEILAGDSAADSLTKREVEVLRMVAEGNRNRDVATRLRIADEAVRMHMKSILGKLRAQDRSQAVKIALSRGMFRV